MSVSARNQLYGKVSAIHPGSVNDEIEISLTAGGKLVSVVTSSSRIRLALEQGKEVVALIKAPWIILASEDDGMLFSARNQFPGVIHFTGKGGSKRNRSSSDGRRYNSYGCHYKRKRDGNGSQ